MGIESIGDIGTTRVRIHSTKIVDVGGMVIIARAMRAIRIATIGVVGGRRAFVRGTRLFQSEKINAVVGGGMSAVPDDARAVRSVVMEGFRVGGRIRIIARDVRVIQSGTVDVEAEVEVISRMIVIALVIRLIRSGTMKAIVAEGRSSTCQDLIEIRVAEREKGKTRK
ncbi:hypothetical protein BDV96DRAFT_633023 [Lophiotrema nucula]|uniref:Uncharacterized protein n=1 Tax=Lophiotrema nucula TaxID=690887 RepID=A0A6A5Z5E3_9PLEO|nr:hypothetical protein BDV96DRAFT_633023 [Lophiotrema nucula]